MTTITSPLNRQPDLLDYSSPTQFRFVIHQLPKVEFFTTKEGRKEMITSLKKEIRKANKKENYLDDEEKILIKEFIFKIKKELELEN